MICREDVFGVAKQLKFKITNKDADKIIKEHEDYCADDPTGLWDAIIETQLYENFPEKQAKEKPKKVSGKFTDKEVYKVVDAIRKIKVPYSDRVANYVEANVDDVLECYKEVE
jgi:hypothetical protein